MRDATFPTVVHSDITFEHNPMLQRGIARIFVTESFSHP
jgi:hypothetical protein